MNKFCLVAALVGLSSIYAQPAQETQAVKPKKTIPSRLKKNLSLYEAFDNEGYVNFGMRADALYMIYNSSILTYAADQSVQYNTSNSTIVAVPGKLSTGLNVALTYTMEEQPRYSFESSWYHIVSQFSNNHTSTRLMPAHSVALTTAANGNSSVNAHVALNFFDLIMMKKFSFGDWFTLTPAAGFVGGYINSKNSAKFIAGAGTFGSNTTYAEIHQKIKFEGLGLKIGTRAGFNVGYGLKIMSEFFFNTLYGRTIAKLNYISNGSYAGLANALSTYRHHHGRMFFDSLLGLAWETTFDRDALYLELHAGWRFQTFANGWMEFEAEFNNSLHDLTLYGQGLQAGATFKF